MARRGRHKKHHHRRRRVGGFSTKGIVGILGQIVVAAGGAFVGVAGGRLLNNAMVSPATGKPTIPGLVLGGGETLVGGYIGLKAKHNFIKGMGFGFAGNGAVYAAGSRGLGLLPASIGYGPDPMHRPARGMLQGFRDVPKIGNFPKPNVIGAARDRRRMANMYAGVYG